MHHSTGRAGEESPFHANGQEWLVSWHNRDVPPPGTAHGSAGICVTPADGIVFISADGLHWDFPAGRPEGTESWEETLVREMREEACAIVRHARLLGFSRGRCVRGSEKGLVLVRAFWRADVVLEPWAPTFEIRHRRLVPSADVWTYLESEAENLPIPIYRRALHEAGVT